MSGLPSDFFNLVAIDPPYNTGKKQENWRDGMGYSDSFGVVDLPGNWEVRLDNFKTAIASGFQHSQSMGYYLAFMGLRLVEMRRVLRHNGCIFLQCDSNASHYLKILLDCVFGGRNFRNSIIWPYSAWPAKSNHFQRNHDVIHYFGKSDDHKLKVLFKAMSPKQIETQRRGYKLSVHSGKKRVVVYDKDSPDFQRQLALGAWRDREICYVEKTERVRLDDVWHVDKLGSTAYERCGYPTQKPLQLYQRIVEAGSSENDWVLDCFAGSGTTLIASELMGRNWVGVDVLGEAKQKFDSRFQSECGLLFQ